MRPLLWLGYLAVAAAAATGPKITDLKKLQVVTSSDAFDELMATPCAVIFHLGKEDSFDGAAELAKELEGLVRIAAINTDTNADLVKDKEIDVDSEWLVKSFGGDELASHKDLAAARAAAEESNPADRVNVVPNQQGIQTFLSEAYAKVKIPVMLFHDKDEVPSLLTKVALWMGDDFEFGSFSKAPPDLLQGMTGQKGTKAPLMLAFVPQEDKEQKGRIQFAPAPYDKARMGALKFKNVFKFAMMVRAELGQAGFFDRREKADGPQAQAQAQKPKGSTKTQPLFEYTPDTPDGCSEDKLGLCIIGILDGSPMNDAKAAQLQVLEEVQASPSNKGRILHFMWVDLTCHPSFGAHFGVSVDNLPAVIAVSPKKQAWAQHFGAFEKVKVGGFIGGVLTGRNRISKLPPGGVPPVSADDNCTAAHAALMPIEEDEIDMDDILKELQAEAEAEKAEEANTMADLEAQAADAEMAAKRKRAEAEAARMSKASNKGRRKKKKKTKRKKNGSGKKDEL